MSYDPSNPPTRNLTSLPWAIWTARTASADVSTSPTWTDEQWSELLTNCAWIRTIETALTTYYRPYEAAAYFLLTPEVITQRSVGGVSETYLSPQVMAEELRRFQASLDQLIPAGDEDTETFSLRMYIGGWE